MIQRDRILLALAVAILGLCLSCLCLAEQMRRVIALVGEASCRCAVPAASPGPLTGMLTVPGWPVPSAESYLSIDPAGAKPDVWKVLNQQYIAASPAFGGESGMPPGKSLPTHEAAWARALEGWDMSGLRYHAIFLDR